MPRTDTATGGRRLRSATALTQFHKAGLPAAAGPGPNQSPADALLGARDAAKSMQKSTPIRDIGRSSMLESFPEDNIAIFTKCQRASAPSGRGAGGIDPISGALLGDPGGHPDQFALSGGFGTVQRAARCALSDTGLS